MPVNDELRLTVIHAKLHLSIVYKGSLCPSLTLPGVIKAQSN